jgi:hypothetical protein
MGILKKSILVVLLMGFCVMYAQAPLTIKVPGKLLDVEGTSTTPTTTGLSEYRVLMEIEATPGVYGVKPYLFWMTYDQSEELKGAILQQITIYYHWDGKGKRIFEKFDWGLHLFLHGNFEYMGDGEYR